MTGQRGHGGTANAADLKSAAPNGALGGSIPPAHTGKYSPVLGSVRRDGNLMQTLVVDRYHAGYGSRRSGFDSRQDQLRNEYNAVMVEWYTRHVESVCPLWA